MDARAWELLLRFPSIPTDLLSVPAPVKDHQIRERTVEGRRDVA